MKAVIMAGGKGTRLRPLTNNIPKPMVPLVDRPVMEYILELLVKHGITEIAVTLQYMPHVIRNHFGDGSSFGVKLHYFEEKEPLGTAGSVRNASAFLDEPFLVISGDGLTDFNLSEAITWHKQKQALGTIVLTEVENPMEFGCVVKDEEKRITQFLEKPKSWDEVISNIINTGIYIFEPEIFKYIPEHGEYDFGKQLFPSLLKHKKPLYGLRLEGYWSDIGTLQQYTRTQWDMLNGKVDVNLKPRSQAAQKEIAL